MGGKNMPEITYLDNPMDTDALMDKLCPPVRNWFKDKFPDFTVHKSLQFQQSWMEDISFSAHQQVQVKR